MATHHHEASQAGDAKTSRCPHVHASPRTPSAEDALANAEAYCLEQDRAWTPARRRAYELLLAAGGPSKAYDLIADFRTDGGATSPTTVYRALDFLVDVGLVHRLVSSNAFLACTAPDHRHTAQFLTCDCCGRTNELALGAEKIMEHARPDGFQVSSVLLEARGHCPDCAEPTA